MIKNHVLKTVKQINQEQTVNIPTNDKKDILISIHSEMKITLKCSQFW